LTDGMNYIGEDRVMNFDKLFKYHTCE